MAPKYTINKQEYLATLELFSGGSYLTDYEYDNGEVTMSARALTVFSHSEYKDRVREIEFWVAAIRKELSPSTYSHVIFEMEMKRVNGTLTFKQEIDGDQTIDASYNYSTKEFTFQARGQRVLNFREFVHFYDGLNLFLIESEKLD